MKAYGYSYANLDSGCIIKIISDTGDTLAVTEFYTWLAAKDHSHKFCPKGYEYEWLDKPFQNKNFLAALAALKERSSRELQA